MGVKLNSSKKSKKSRGKINHQKSWKKSWGENESWGKKKVWVKKIPFKSKYKGNISILICAEKQTDRQTDKQTNIWGSNR